MTTVPRSSTHSIGRYTGLVLGLVVFVCVTMIGLAGYLKYELDRAESVLAAPEAASGDQDSYDKLRRTLGYSGFVGVAQSYVAAHDPSALADMKAQIKDAHDIINHLPEKTPTETRRDLQAIAATFDVAMLRADKSSTEPSITFTTDDIIPLYASLPVLDSRITGAAAVTRLAAQNHLQFWAMLLTLVSWCSLIVAAAMSVGIYLSLRDRNSAPMRALAQSIKNMAHGDLQTSIWGMERSDMVGELARATDLARYHFSQLPDMSLLSDKGPVRIRFEGNTKTMFEAMMHLITRDSEQVRHQAQSLAEITAKQQQSIVHLSGQVEAVLHGILERGQTGDQQVKHVIQDMLGSAQSLKRAQEHAADQLNRIVPFLQERAQGLSEITQITGKQVSQVLQNLILTERGLKKSAEQSVTAIQKLSATADDMGSRLFGAVNLLQASGKVLAETTETTQSRLNEAIEKLHQTIQQPLVPPAVSKPIIDPSEILDLAINESVVRLEKLIDSLEGAHKKLEEIFVEQTEAAKAQIELLTTQSTSMITQSTTTVQTLSTAAEHLREKQAKFDQSLHQITERLDVIGGRFEQQANAQATALSRVSIGPDEQTQFLLADISAQINDLKTKFSVQQQPAQSPEGGLSDNLLLEVKSGFETTVRSLAQMREQLTNMVINNQAQAPVMMPSDNHWLDLAAQIETTRNSLALLVTNQIERVEMRLSMLNNKPQIVTPPVLPHDVQEQMEQQTQILTELVATLGVLDEHMQQLKTDMQTAKAW